jgi:uncharacterized protein (DUF1330 family)
MTQTEAHAGTTHTSFTKEIFDAFKANDRPGPIHMLNLIRFHDEAVLPDGSRTTGRAAYDRYGEISAPVFARLGGRIVWRGDFEQTLVGPAQERWDAAFVAEYPSPDAFVQLMRDPVYREAMRHRQAAVADSRLVRFGALALGVTFNGR